MRFPSSEYLFLGVIAYVFSMIFLFLFFAYGHSQNDVFQGYLLISHSECTGMNPAQSLSEGSQSWAAGDGDHT